jgi:hypothetical protein
VGIREGEAPAEPRIAEGKYALNKANHHFNQNRHRYNGNPRERTMAANQPAKKPQQPRLSLYGMTPEDALRKALTTPPPPDKPPERSKAKIKQRKGKAG